MKISLTDEVECPTIAEVREWLTVRGWTIEERRLEDGVWLLATGRQGAVWVKRSAFMRAPDGNTVAALMGIGEATACAPAQIAREMTAGRGGT